MNLIFFFLVTTLCNRGGVSSTGLFIEADGSAFLHRDDRYQITSERGKRKQVKFSKGCITNEK